MTVTSDRVQTFATPAKRDADYVFYELKRSICPECRRVIDAQILLRDDKVYMRKRCPEHGNFEALVYGDAQACVAAAKYNKPGTIPLAFATEDHHRCPHDCGLCPDHQQHACVGIIEVNSACNMSCSSASAWQPGIITSSVAGCISIYRSPERRGAGTRSGRAERVG